MKKVLLSPLMLLLFCITSSGQGGVCEQMTRMEKKLTIEANKFLAITSPTIAQMKDFAITAKYYKTYYLGEVDRTYYTQKSIAAVLGIKAIGIDMLIQKKMGNDNAALEDALTGLDIMQYIDAAYNYEMICNEGNSRTKIDKTDYQSAASYFLTSAVETAFYVNKPQLAMKFFMRGVIDESYNGTAKVNIMAGTVLEQRLNNKQVDDTTFWAAYHYLNTSHAEKSFFTLLGEFGHSHEAEALKVITDPMFLKHKMMKEKYLGYRYYAPYYQDLFSYLQQDTIRDNWFAQQVLKMTLKTYYANGKDGLYPSRLSGSLKYRNAIDKIIETGDQELMDLLADFISKEYKGVEYEDLYYSAYKLYHAMGDEKKADKIFNRIDKSRRERYNKL
ncbi:MAG: hypothetical protein ABI685_07745 [Ferruginibacter sp.]